MADKPRVVVALPVGGMMTAAHVRVAFAAFGDPVKKVELIQYTQKTTLHTTPDRSARTALKNAEYGVLLAEKTFRMLWEDTVLGVAIGEGKIFIPTRDPVLFSVAWAGRKGQLAGIASLTGEMDQIILDEVLVSPCFIATPSSKLHIEYPRGDSYNPEAVRLVAFVNQCLDEISQRMPPIKRNMA